MWFLSVPPPPPAPQSLLVAYSFHSQTDMLCVTLIYYVMARAVGVRNVLGAVMEKILILFLLLGVQVLIYSRF